MRGGNKMYAYVLTVKQILEYGSEWGVNPDEWKDLPLDQKFAMIISKPIDSLPSSCRADVKWVTENGLKLDICPDFGDVGKG